MLSASLDQRITIQNKTESKDSLGTPSAGWAELASVAASAIEMNGTSSFNQKPEQEVHSFNTLFIFRHLENFGYDCRILFESEIFEIQSIQILRRQEGFKVVAKRMVNNG